MSEAHKPHSDPRGAISRHSFLPLVTFTSPEGHEFVAREAFDELAAEASSLRDRYDSAYENGENSGYADWVGALGDYCEKHTPEEGWTPTSSVAVINGLLEQLEAAQNRLAEIDEWVSAYQTGGSDAGGALDGIAETLDASIPAKRPS